MKERIIYELKQIEEMENIKIIYACESGSRAWGFESDDSDNDIRFIYVRPPMSYFSVRPLRDVIDRNKGNIDTSKYIRDLENANLDFVGFDIKKAMELITLGNPALAEWLQSPINYRNVPFIVPAIQKLSEQFFKSKAGIYHYEHMARKNFTQYIINVTGDVIVKKYLYVLRPIYACEYISLFGKAPPMNFETLFTDETILKNDDFRNVLIAVKDLVDRKKAGEELGKGPHVNTLDDFCAKKLEFYKKCADELSTHELTDGDYNHIDRLFFDIVCK